MHEFLERPVQLHERIAYGVTQAADALSVGKSTIWRLLKEGRIKAVHLGGRTVIPRTELIRLLDEAEAAADAKKGAAYPDLQSAAPFDAPAVKGAPR